MLRSPRIDAEIWGLMVESSRQIDTLYLIFVFASCLALLSSHNSVFGSEMQCETLVGGYQRCALGGSALQPVKPASPVKPAQSSSDSSATVTLRCNPSSDDHSLEVFVNPSKRQMIVNAESWQLFMNDDEYQGLIIIDEYHKSFYQKNTSYDQTRRFLTISRRTGAFNYTVGWTNYELRSNGKYSELSSMNGSCQKMDAPPQKF
jgi:hypothetical protein